MNNNENGDLISIRGEIEDISFKNIDNGFAVVTLDVDGEPVCVVGELGLVEEGESLDVTGRYVDHPRYGKQFSAQMCERSLPETTSAIQKYLASGVIKGIGHVTAKAIVKKFGEQTLDIIENDYEKLTEIKGITPKQAAQINKDFKNTFAARSLMTYLTKLGVETVYSVRAWKAWGSYAKELIEKNPYIMTQDEVGLRFDICDDLASKMGIEADDLSRIKAGQRFVLKENADAGHTCLPLKSLERVSCEFLKIDSSLFKKALEAQIEEEELFFYYKDKVPYVALKVYYAAEDYISRRLSIMSSISFDTKTDYSAIIDIDEEENGITYESKQREAINLALSKGFLVLTGGPGTGKTTTLNAIISLFEQQAMSVMIAAPTGRAAKRISDLTGFEAKTIHRLLEVGHGADGRLMFLHKENNLLDCDVMIVDEMSMVDAELFEALLRALPVSCKLILVGDNDQLPSVGAGNVLGDIIESGVMPVVRLTEIFRQARESAIVTNAHKIVKGEMIDLTDKSNKDFFFIQRLEYEALQSYVTELCKERLPKTYGFDPTGDIQVLSPTRKGGAGTIELNKRLQAELNPPSKEKSEIKAYLYTFRKGDKVMQTKNDYDILWTKSVGDKDEQGTGIFNGDIGHIVAVNKFLKTATIDFDGRVAVYNYSMLENIELAYAVTVHKSQGSEFDAVILTLFSGFDKLYYRNLLYTAVTRAKKLLIIVGKGKRVEYMIKNNIRNQRFTCLKEMLIEQNGDGNEQESIEEILARLDISE